MIGSLVLAAVAGVFGIGLIFGCSGWCCRSASRSACWLAVSIFGRRVQSSVYAKAEGQPGAAGWALDNMRGPWRVSQASRAPPTSTPCTG